MQSLVNTFVDCFYFNFVTLAELIGMLKMHLYDSNILAFILSLRRFRSDIASNN